ncbi:hypothetical protein Esti_003521 [Eimeria stiedai]
MQLGSKHSFLLLLLSCFLSGWLCPNVFCFRGTRLTGPPLQLGGSFVGRGPPPPEQHISSSKTVRGAPHRGSPGLFAADARVPSGPYERLRRLIDIKKQEVQQLQHQHSSLQDPLQLRQHYVSHRHNGKVIEKLRVRSDPRQLRGSLQGLLEAANNPEKQYQAVQQQQRYLSKIRGHEQCQQQQQQQQQQSLKASLDECLRTLEAQDPDESALSVVCEVKRYSKITSRGNPSRLAFTHAAEVVVPLAQAGADVLLVATDHEAWGGTLRDLEEASRALRGAYDFASRPALLMKDLIIHPIQIAQAAEAGADGVYLIHSVAGAALEELLFAACVAGIEAVVEVHGAGEARQAIAAGATLLVANQADRLTGLLYPNSAVEVREAVLPETIVAAKGGLNSLDDAKLLARCGVDSVVVGRALLREDAFEFVRSLKAVKAGPRSLVHLFADAEAQAATLRKAREEEAERRRQTRREKRQQDSSQPGKPSLSHRDPTAVAALCAELATAGGGGGALDEVSLHTEVQAGLAAKAALEAYSTASHKRGPPEASSLGPIHQSFASPPHAARTKPEDELTALDASLKTRVVRISGSSKEGEQEVQDSPGGLVVSHSLDFCSSSSVGCSTSSSSSSRSSSVESAAAETDEDAVLQHACEDLLAAASEKELEGGGEEEISVSSLLADPTATASPEALAQVSAVPRNLLPRKVLMRDASGEVVETVIDPLAAAVKDLDPKLVDSLVEEARTNPQAFAAATQQRIMRTLQQAEQQEVLDLSNLQAATASTPSAPQPVLPALVNSKQQGLLLMRRQETSAEGREPEAPWATPAVPGASEEEVRGWLKDLNLQRAARFFLTPEETQDFFGRLHAAADNLWGPVDKQGAPVQMGSAERPLEGVPEKPEASVGESKSLHQDCATRRAGPLHSALKGALVAPNGIVPANGESSAAAQETQGLHARSPSEASGQRSSSNAHPAQSFRAEMSPVSFREWLLKPERPAASLEEPSAQDLDGQTRMAFSRVGCVEARRSLASAYDNMEPYVQFFQQEQQRQQMPSGPEASQTSSPHSPQADGGSPGAYVTRATKRIESSPCEEGQEALPLGLNEEALRELLPPLEDAPQSFVAEAWADSGGIEIEGIE